MRSAGPVSPWRGHDFEGLPVGTVIVAHQIARRRIPRKCFHDLLRQPFGSRVPRNGKPEQLSSTVAYDEKRKEALKCQGSNHAEIDCAMAPAWLCRNVHPASPSGL